MDSQHLPSFSSRFPSLRFVFFSPHRIQYATPQVGDQFGHGPRHVLEDAYDGCYQLAHNPLLALAFAGTIISIAFFNFAGISITKELSATTRMVLDSVRTLVIWMVRCKLCKNIKRPNILISFPALAWAGKTSLLFSCLVSASSSLA